MNIDSAKSNTQIPKEKQTANSLRVEVSLNQTSLTNTGSNTGQSSVGFENYLKDKNTSNQLNPNEKPRNNSLDEKSIEKEEKQTTSDKKLKEQDEKSEKTKLDGRNDKDQDKGFGDVQLKATPNLFEINSPNPRSILHIADLERIISKIRSQSFANGKQVTINLNRSIFEGLQLRLTFVKEKGVIAEFFAANEAIKSQLVNRENELATLLKNRGVKLDQIQMSLSSDSNSQNNHNSNNQSNFSKNTTAKITQNQTVEDAVFNDSDTSYQI